MMFEGRLAVGAFGGATTARDHGIGLDGLIVLRGVKNTFQCSDDVLQRLWATSH